MLYHILSSLGFIEDKSVKLYQSILKGNEEHVDEILNLFFRPEYTDMGRGNDILAFSACVHPNIANRLFHAYDRQISYREKGKIFRKAAMSGSVQGVTVLLRHCAKEIDPVRAIQWVLEKNCNQVIGAVISGFLEHHGESIIPDVTKACESIEEKMKNRQKFSDIVSDALCHAAAEGQYSAVQILLKHYDEKISPEEKKIAFRNATREGHDEIIGLFLKQRRTVQFGELQIKYYSKKTGVVEKKDNSITLK